MRREVYLWRQGADYGLVSIVHERDIDGVFTSAIDDVPGLRLARNSLCGRAFRSHFQVCKAPKRI